MNINGVLLFLSSFITITVFVNKVETSPQVESLSERNFNAFEKDCSYLKKIIDDNNVTNYLTNCQYSTPNIRKITEEAVLQYACFIGENIISYLCKNKIPITSEYLNLEVDNNTSICPFNFSQIELLKTFVHQRVGQELNENEHCKKVCFDLYDPKNQCVVLSKLIKFLSSLSIQEVPKDEVVQENKETSQTESKVLSSTLPKTEKSKKLVTKESHEVFLEQPQKIVTQKPEMTANKPEASNTRPQQDSTIGGVQQESDKELWVEKPIPEEEKTLKPVYNTQSSTSPKLKTPDTSNNDFNAYNGNDEMKTIKNENAINEGFENDDDPELDNLGPSMSQVPDMPRLEESEMDGKYLVNKKSSFQESLNQNEVYAGEGFFQAEESHFFFYFLMFSSVIIIGYLAFHNKNKILAYALEGSSGRRNRRRPNPARYRKLESNLEEAISSSASQAAATSVVY